MSPEIVQLDTWIKTFALEPAEISHWNKIGEEMLNLKSRIDFTLSKEMTTTGKEETFILEKK